MEIINVASKQKIVLLQKKIAKLQIHQLICNLKGTKIYLKAYLYHRPFHKYNLKSTKCETVVDNVVKVDSTQ